MNVKYRFRELRSLAKNQHISRWHQMNKSELCLALNLEPPKSKKFSLTCIMTLEVTTWESSYSISKAFKVNTGCVFYAIKVGKPLKTSVGSFVVVKN